ncbi:unnamed protein product, partial [Phaeothamnion confervicola]
RQVKSIAARLALLAWGTAAALIAGPAPGWAQSPAEFSRFVEGVWPDAQKAGVSRATFDLAFKGVTADLSLPDLVLAGKKEGQERGQAEFVRPPQDYLDRGQLARLAENGRAFMAKHIAALERIEKEIGVERHVVMGIWGRETAYGTHKLPHYAIRVLATQAFVGRRKEMFRAELIAGLRMLQDRVTTIPAMRSSWAGALGLPQFMPTEYYIHAYDLDGDGKKDIWNSVPDALASAARQLKGKGWTKGVPWGIEIKLPEQAAGQTAARIDCALEGPDDGRPLAEWARLGVKRVDGSPLPEGLKGQSAYLMSPGGTHGPVFLAAD